VNTANAYPIARQANVLAESSAPRMRELEIQARLYNGDYGLQWITTCGEKFRVIHFGEWNREAGPDFKNARIEFEKRGTEVGDIEVDWDARDWENHGHAQNPCFTNTRLHFYIEAEGAVAFARSCENRHIPQARLLIGGPPVQIHRFTTGAVSADAARAMIDSAARFRLGNKHAAFHSTSRLHGEDAALFFAVAAGLGYKNNAIPFLLAVQRIGLKAILCEDGEAMLFGISGFLEPRDFDDADEITKTYLKPLWDSWWKVRDTYSRSVLPRSLWRFSGVRPSNHPHRRLGALAAAGRKFFILHKQIHDLGEEGFLHFFEQLEHPYWTRHWNLSADPLTKPLALVGSDRATDLLLNAYLPSLAPEAAEKRLREIRGPQPSSILKLASVWLLGEALPLFFKSAWDQQGLLQLYRDFGAISAEEAWMKIQGAT
jgi:hypothetical protein